MHSASISRLDFVLINQLADRKLGEENPARAKRSPVQIGSKHEKTRAMQEQNKSNL